MVRIRLTEMVTFERRPEGHERGSMMENESISCSGNEGKVPEVGMCLDCLWHIRYVSVAEGNERRGAGGQKRGAQVLSC